MLDHTKALNPSSISVMVAVMLQGFLPHAPPLLEDPGAGSQNWCLFRRFGVQQDSSGSVVQGPK